MTWLSSQPYSCGELLHGLGEDGTAMGVVAEHVETGASRREQHRVARLRGACSRLHGIFEETQRAQSC